MIGGVIAGDGLDGQGVGFVVGGGEFGVGGVGIRRVPGPGFHEELFEGFATFFAFVEVCGWGEEAEFGVFDDLFHGEGGVRVGKTGREVGGGDLEAVEEETGATRGDLVGGEAKDDFADGGLDGGAVFRAGEEEGGLAGADALLCFPFWDGFTGDVMVVAKFLPLEARGAAAMTG